MKLTLHFDGSCWVNPGGTAKYGWTLSFPDGGKIWDNGPVGEGPLMSNNLAELYALAKGLAHSLTHAKTGDIIEVFGDSEIAVKLMQGKYKANKEKLYYPAYEYCKKIEFIIHSKNIDVQYNWIPREKNQEADDLSKLPLNSEYDTYLAQQLSNPSVKDFFEKETSKMTTERQELLDLADEILL